MNGKAKKVHVTDTLVTKILLGTLGCMPAYDTFFIEGLRTKKLKHSRLTKKSFLSIIRFYQRNRKGFDSAQQSIKHSSGITYPTMKLVDMYFWQSGLENGALDG